MAAAAPPPFATAGARAATVPKPAKEMKYGTAGFRDKADVLDSTCLRVGCLAALRSLAADGAPIGVVVTASHNPVADNGLKITDPDGGMLSQSWEKHATALANAPDDGVEAALAAIAAAEGVDTSKAAAVFVAMDTRPSSPHLCGLVRDGAIAAGADVVDFGVLTTPQLHHIVRMWNTGKREWAHEKGHYEMLAKGYREVLQGVEPAPVSRGTLIVDGALGVGGLQIPKVAVAMDGLLCLEARNVPGEAGELNNGVGAEHVQKTRTPPRGVSITDSGRRIASLDGDADRIVYHFFDRAGKWHLLDGDAIAALAATFLRDQLADLGWSVDGSDGGPTVGVVQTAYANGAATAYIRETLGLPVPLAKTGVKFVHHKAAEYDLGVYFEANGHGTILFSSAILARLSAMRSATGMSAKAKLARDRLLGASLLINQAVGDAISDALFIEAVLCIKGWTVEDWDGMYTDLPSRQTKLAVKDRSIVVTTTDETRVTEPASLQAAIDALVGAVPKGRAFVRPSGTEDVVRVYAEAATEEAANELAFRVASAAYEHAGGVGEAPKPMA